VRDRGVMLDLALDASRIRVKRERNAMHDFPIAFPRKRGLDRPRAPDPQPQGFRLDGWWQCQPDPAGRHDGVAADS
jgi:hypothetical protein